MLESDWGILYIRESRPYPRPSSSESGDRTQALAFFCNSAGDCKAQPCLRTSAHLAIQSSAWPKNIANSWEFMRYAGSQAPPQTYWIRIHFLARPPSPPRWVACTVKGGEKLHGTAAAFHPPMAPAVRTLSWLPSKVDLAAISAPGSKHGADPLTCLDKRRMFLSLSYRAKIGISQREGKERGKEGREAKRMRGMVTNTYFLF